MTQLTLQDGTTFEGESFGAQRDIDGEVVFNTGMVGYTESLTDPSYRGQILVFTYPLIGNYGVPSEELNEYNFSKNFESEDIHVRGVVVAHVSGFYSHFTAVSSLHNWLVKYNIPGITGVDTRVITKKLREHGVMLGCIGQNDQPPDSSSHGISDVPRSINRSIKDPNMNNLVAEVSCKKIITYEPLKHDQVLNGKTVIVYDCGIKRGILRSLLKRGVRVIRVPWDFDLASHDGRYDGVLISNGPGDPKTCTETITNIRFALEQGIPTFGICLGCQLMALAVCGDTSKLTYGHRGANQPCIESGTKRCLITSQNHGYAVSPELPKDWNVWFTNANDGTVEGIRHKSGKFFAIQFHPEASPGPEDASYLFDEFIKVMKD
jgi:carbamoyl-phosphate synthase small subunit